MPFDGLLHLIGDVLAIQLDLPQVFDEADAVERLHVGEAPHHLEKVRSGPNVEADACNARLVNEDELEALDVFLPQGELSLGERPTPEPEASQVGKLGKERLHICLLQMGAMQSYLGNSLVLMAIIEEQRK